MGKEGKVAEGTEGDRDRYERQGQKQWDMSEAKTTDGTEAGGRGKRQTSNGKVKVKQRWR